MSEAAILWLFGTLIGLVSLVLCGIAKLLIDHIRDCRDVHAKLAEISIDVKHVKDELGDREKGIRGLLHLHSKFHTENEGRFSRLEEKLELPEWNRKKRRREDI